MTLFRYYEAPAIYTPAGDDPPAVFLAGGIPHVELWHDRIINLLRASGRPMVVLNPRRLDFPTGDRDTNRAQVAWEHAHLHLAAMTLFWFPAPAPDAPVPITSIVQPTTLLELGVALGERRRIVVGADELYQRRDILEYQLEHHPHVVLLDRLEEVVAGVLGMVEELTASAGVEERGR